MTSTHFPEANTRYGPPPDLTDAQCGIIYAHEAAVERGSVEGAHMVITAWKPDARELEALNAGAPVYMSMLGRGLAPHFLSTSFDVASNPA
jgi:hypothetical protein